mgnify:CR=1 FL=1
MLFCTSHAVSSSLASCYILFIFRIVLWYKNQVNIQEEGFCVIQRLFEPCYDIIDHHQIYITFDFMLQLTKSFMSDEYVWCWGCCIGICFSLSQWSHTIFTEAFYLVDIWIGCRVHKHVILSYRAFQMIPSLKVQSPQQRVVWNDNREIDCKLVMCTVYWCLRIKQFALEIMLLFVYDLNLFHQMSCPIYWLRDEKTLMLGSWSWFNSCKQTDRWHG